MERAIVLFTELSSCSYSNGENMKYIKTLIIMTALFLISGMTVFAGDINTDELRVIEVASSPQTYNGKQYVSSESSIRRLTAYMNQDDVNLSASQADKAITKFMENISLGIQEGYMLPVESDTPAPTKEPGNTPDANEDNSETASNATAKSTTTAKPATAVEPEGEASTASVNKENEELIAAILEANSLPEEEAAATLESTVETETTSDDEATTETLSSEESGPDFSHAGEFSKGMNILLIAAIIVGIVALGCVITIYINKKKYK